MPGLRNGEFSDDTFTWIFPVRFWFSCGIFKRRRQSQEFQSEFKYAEGYSRPPLWKRMLRKLKAESRHVHVACCHWCDHDSMSHLYTDLSYQKNFDQGQLHHHSFQASARHASLVQMNLENNTIVNTSNEMDLLEELTPSTTEHGDIKIMSSVYLPEDDSTPLWHKDRQGLPKKVSFAT